MKEKMKNEAIARMEFLNIHSSAIKEFADEDKLNLSVGIFLYHLNDAQLRRVHEFETETDCMVYHVILSNTAIGHMLTFLYVSLYMEEWEQDQKDLEEKTPIAYVANIDDEVLSEFGVVGIETCSGAVIRTA